MYPRQVQSCIDHSFINLTGEEDIHVMTRNQLSEPSFRNSTSNSGSSHGFLKKRLTSPIRGEVLDIVIGKLALGQRASAPTDAQLKDSEYKFCKKK
jgi:hypothetical protein